MSVASKVPSNRTINYTLPCHYYVVRLCLPRRGLTILTVVFCNQLKIFTPSNNSINVATTPQQNTATNLLLQHSCCNGTSTLQYNYNTAATAQLQHYKATATS